jgi:Ca2+-binding EF-hand superfamily protein
MISDALLRTYVDEVFMTYDRDRSGSLETNELAHFFNDVFEKMNSNERFTS